MDVPRKMTSRPRLRRIVLVAGGVAVLAAATFGFRALRARPPQVDRDALWIGQVERGELRLEVRGVGTLVPEEIRWASAPLSARVDKVLVQPGAEVLADAVLIELANPDAELAVLDAEREVATAKAELARLSAALDTARLAQESTIAQLDADHSIAKRRAEVDDGMSKEGVTSTLEAAESADRADQLGSRLSFEKKRLRTMKKSDDAQLDAQRAEIDRLTELAAFRRRQLDDLKVRAGATGVVQDVAVEVGQTVAMGAPLAKVVRPDKLKAELRIAESFAQDLTIGLPAVIDTRSGMVNGRVSRIDPAAANGFVTIDVALEGPLPRGARPDLSIDGTIELARADQVLHMARPTVGEARATVQMFKLTPDGEAVRVSVTFGRGSVDRIEVVSGLSEGDRVILSDTSRWDGHDRLSLQ